MTTSAQFEALVHQHHAAVYRTAARLLAPADAEDVTQQVFLRVLEGKAQLGDDPGVSLRWLAGNLALNALRGSRTRRRNEGLRAMRTEDTTHDDHASADERRALRRALEDLPTDLRAAVVLRYQEELTFEAVARGLACSLSTAHDRVRRALERLQHALLASGFAFSTGRVSDLLPRLDPPPTLPVGLADQILRLRAGLPAAASSGTSSTTASAGAIAVLAVVALGVAAWFGLAHERDVIGRTPTPAAAAGAPAAAFSPAAGDGATRQPLADASPAVVAVAAQEPADGRAHVIGNVYDEADGRPLAATVHADSLRRGKKGEPFRRSVDADPSGRFDLEVPVPASGIESYTFWVRVPDYAPFHLDLGLRDGETRDVRVALHRWATDTPGEWTLAVVVQDEAGQPVANAAVVVFREASAEPGTEPTRETTATTDAAGRATLRGDHHGEKVLRVRAERLAPVTRRLAVLGPEPPAVRVGLRPALTLSGIVRAVADGAPVAAYCVSARQDDEDVSVGCSDRDGRFKITGLGHGAVTLVGTNSPWSRFELGGLAPDADDVELRLKRWDDADPHGLHAGELHGRVLDAATHEPLDVSVWDVDPVWLEGENWRDELIDGLLHPRPVQRASAFTKPQPSPDFHLSGLRPGRYAVAARRRGYAPAFLGPFDVTDATFRADLELALAPGGTVVGEVVDAGGHAVPHAVVYLTVAADPTPAAQATQRALAGGDRYVRYRYPETDAQGRFRLAQVPAGLTLHCVAVDAERGVATSAPLVVRDGAETTVRLQVQ